MDRQQTVPAGNAAGSARRAFAQAPPVTTAQAAGERARQRGAGRTTWVRILKPGRLAVASIRSGRPARVPSEIQFSVSPSISLKFFALTTVPAFQWQ